MPWYFHILYLYNCIFCYIWSNIPYHCWLNSTISPFIKRLIKSGRLASGPRKYFNRGHMVMLFTLRLRCSSHGMTPEIHRSTIAGRVWPYQSPLPRKVWCKTFAGELLVFTMASPNNPSAFSLKIHQNTMFKEFWTLNTLVFHPLMD